MEWLGFMVSFGFYMDLHSTIEGYGEDEEATDDIEEVEEEIEADLAEEDFDEDIGL